MRRKYSKQKNATLKQAKNVATKKEDKLQNKVLSKITRRVSRLERKPEIKCFYNNQVIMSGTTAGSWFAGLTKDIVYGTDDNSRIGDSVNARSIHIKGTLNMATMTNVSFVRLILVVYKESYYNFPPNINCLLNSNDFRSFYNSETKKDQFTILYDKTFNLIQNTNKAQYYISIHKNLRNKLHWDSGLALNAPTQNHIFLYIISDQQQAPYPYLDFTSVFYYTDE